MVSGELDRLQGVWRQVRYERDGLVEPEDQEHGGQPVATIESDKFSVAIEGGTDIIKGRFVLHEALEPPGIDWIEESGLYAADPPILAIYEVSEAHFVSCAACDGAPRPRRFETAPGLVLGRMVRVGRTA
jgi:uncharacterized protein (TIGR03067 family)